MSNINLKDKYISLKKKLFDTYYLKMNAPQKEAIYTVNGPLLVLAGAGSGKTTVLVNRISHIIRYGNAYYSDFIPQNLCKDDIKRLETYENYEHDKLGEALKEFAQAPCPAWAVLAFTFTNKAAGEIKERLEKAIGSADVSNEIWAGTFHSICVRILRRNANLAGYESSFTIYDPDDSKKLITSCMKRLGIDEKVLSPKAAMSTISRAKDKLLTAADFAHEASSDFRLSRIAQIYTEYERELKRANALDFDDIIMQTVLLLENNEEVRKYYQNRFKYVCVDEFQDTNIAQLRLCEHLSGRYRNIMVVGDDDQSIYKFRGATIENILSFDKLFNNCKQIKLEQNYRSTSNILNAANAVIKNNRLRKGKSLWTDTGDGDKITLKQLPNQNFEAQYVADKILESIKTDNSRFSDFAVLYRMNSQSAPFENVFSKSGIPYRMLGGLRFFDRKEIRDIVAYLCVISNTCDNVRLKRIVNEPKRKIGDSTLAAVEALAAMEKTSIFDIMRRSDEYIQLQKVSNRLIAFTDFIESMIALAENCSVSELINNVVDKSGYHDMLIAEGETGIERLRNIDELLAGAASYDESAENPNLTEYLEDVALVSDTDNYDKSADAVVMMTVHSAKGLEFPIVFIPGLEEGIFPGMLSMSVDDEVEEERRLCYVAITRAKKKLYLLNVRERMMFAKTRYNPPSRFVDEIPCEYINNESEAQKDELRFIVTKKKPKLSSELTSPVTKVQTVPKQPAIIFSEGARVVHPTFGEGTILSAKKMGTDTLYEVAFDTVGTKKLMATFAKLKSAL